MAGQFDSNAPACPQRFEDAIAELKAAVVHGDVGGF
jgi:hypothetical protein